MILSFRIIGIEVIDFMFFIITQTMVKVYEGTTSFRRFEISALTFLQMILEYSPGLSEKAQSRIVELLQQIFTIRLNNDC